MEPELTLADYFSIEIVKKAMQSINWDEGKQGVRNLSDRKFRQLWNMAWAVLYEEKIMRDLLRIGGDANWNKREPRDFQELATCLIAYVEASRRGIPPSEAVSRRVTKQLTVFAQEFGAERVGKLVEMKAK